MNMKIEEYEIDIEQKLKKKIKDLKMNECNESDSDGPNNYEKVI